MINSHLCILYCNTHISLLAINTHICIYLFLYVYTNIYVQAMYIDERHYLVVMADDLTAGGILLRIAGFSSNILGGIALGENPIPEIESFCDCSNVQWMLFICSLQQIVFFWNSRNEIDWMLYVQQINPCSVLIMLSSAWVFC